MNLRIFWLCAGLIFVFIFINQKIALYYYWGALAVTVSYLNSRKQYLREPYKWFNAGFLFYLILVVWERTRHYQFSPFSELMINDLEHVLFAIMICFISTRVLKFSPFNVRSFPLRLLLGILIFNSIGFINEWFQNTLNDRSLFTLIADSQKDIRMNLLGSALFLGCAFAIKRMVVNREEFKGKIVDRLPKNAS
ncbi:MAG: hypothetical protein ABIX01_14225 [Chitinophagaceae bacterium]